MRYDNALPIAAKRDEIKVALERHQVPVIASKTGAGKTRLLPKICLEIGRGPYGLIGDTQPRRLAVRKKATDLFIGQSAAGRQQSKVALGGGQQMASRSHSALTLEA